MPHQGINARLAAAKGFEGLHGRAAAAGFQDGLAVFAAGLDIGRSAAGRFFKGSVSIC